MNDGSTRVWERVAGAADLAPATSVRTSVSLVVTPGVVPSGLEVDYLPAAAHLSELAGP